MVNRYKIADKVVSINSIYEDVHLYCSEYLTHEPTDYIVSISQADIEYEREKSVNEDKMKGIATKNFTDQYLEELAVYRKIAEKMIDYDTVLFHGSVIAVDGIGYLFTAKSGIGKSTHTKLWREFFRERAVMVNDDKPLLKITENGIIAYGSPYNGKHRIGTNISVPLKAICILTRDVNNHIEQITRDQAYAMLLQQVYRPADASKLIKTLALIDIIADNVKLYQLGCNMNILAAKVAYEGMQ